MFGGAAFDVSAENSENSRHELYQSVRGVTQLVVNKQKNHLIFV